MIPAALAAWVAERVGGKAIGYVGAALAAVAFTVAVYQTGAHGERKRGEAETLRRTVTALQRQRDAALAIQTRMAEATAEVRVANEKLRKQADDIVTTFRSSQPQAPIAGRCSCDFSNAERLRVQSIRIGPARSDRTSR